MGKNYNEVDESDQKLVLVFRQDLYQIGKMEKFLSSEGKPHKRAHEIGKLLNELGGLILMQQVAKNVVTELQQRQDKNVARELEYCWNNIGDWLA